MAKAKKKVKKSQVLKRGKDDCSSIKCHEGGAYFLGAIGAAVYYISTASGFWTGVLGILKALIWPAFLVYEVLKFVAA